MNRKLIVRLDKYTQKERRERLVALYSSNDNIRTLADEIHKRRMLPEPTCADCIELAVQKLNVEK